MDGDRELIEFGNHLRPVHDAARQVAGEPAPPDLAAADRALAAARGETTRERAAQPQATPQPESASQRDQAESRAVLTVAAARTFCLLTSVRLRRDDPQSPQLPKLAALTGSLDRLINAGQTTLPLYVPPEGVRALNADDVHASVTAALAHLPGPRPIVFDLLGARELLRSWSAKLDSTKGQLAQANLQALAMLDALEAAGVSGVTALVQPGDFSIARLRAAHAGIVAAHRSLELKVFEQQHTAKVKRPSKPRGSRRGSGACTRARDW